MPTNVNDFLMFTQLCQNKPITGSSVQVGANLNSFMNQAQTVCYNEDRNIFLGIPDMETKGQTTDFLETFLKENIAQINIDGDVTFPDDYEHTCTIGHYLNGNYYPVASISMRDYFDISVSQLKMPEPMFSKVAEHANTFKFLPKNLSSVNIQYFKTPVKPIWGFSGGSGRPVYDANTSVNFEWSESYLNRVAGQYLKLIGINLRQEDLDGFAKEFAQINRTVV